MATSVKGLLAAGQLGAAESRLNRVVNELNVNPKTGEVTGSSGSALLQEEEAGIQQQKGIPKSVRDPTKNLDTTSGGDVVDKSGDVVAKDVVEPEKKSEGPPPEEPPTSTSSTSKPSEQAKSMLPGSGSTTSSKPSVQAKEMLPGMSGVVPTLSGMKLPGGGELDLGKLTGPTLAVVGLALAAAWALFGGN